MAVILSGIAALLLSYLVGSIPSGWVVVKVFTGKDIRQIASGRTGGTNAYRAAGVVAGLLTAGLDVLKGIASGWIVWWLFPHGNVWLQVAAAVMAVIGHNYSIFLIERNEKGHIRLRGGAGGATALGGAVALWPISGIVILPLVGIIYFLVGYASVTTISITVFSILVFAYRAYLGISPTEYILYGVLALGLVLYALRPNLQRLAAGTERPVGLRAYLINKYGEATRPLAKLLGIDRKHPTRK
jgi:acyl phosphate:glycerol-3-phosphate acyltransferase